MEDLSIFSTNVLNLSSNVFFLFIMKYAMTKSLSKPLLFAVVFSAWILFSIPQINTL